MQVRILPSPIIIKVKLMKEIKPTVHRKQMISECCGAKTIIALTNEEIWMGVYIEQWCPKCKKCSKWTQIKK